MQEHITHNWHWMGCTRNPNRDGLVREGLPPHMVLGTLDHYR